MVLQYPHSIMNDAAIHVSSFISGIVTPICVFQLILHPSNGLNTTIHSTIGLLGAISIFSLLPLIAKQTKDLFCKPDTEKTESNPHHTHSYFISLASSTLATSIAYAQMGLIDTKAAIGIGVVSFIAGTAFALRWKMDNDAERKVRDKMSAIGV